jgi:NAD(P)-dependent dehydrogenase (short-subunit alcohol dehydrogenase family)
VAKWGLIGFAKTLAIELGGHNIRANAIAPGAVGGQRIENVLASRAKAEGKSLEDERANMLSIQSLKRFVDPKDIAVLCVFLASDAGKSISGQVIPIDNDALKAS